MSYGSTPLLDIIGFQKEPIGQRNLIITEPRPFGGQPRQRPMSIAQFLFAQFHKLEPFNAERVDEFLFPNVHLIWVTEKVEPKVPTLEEARESIVEFWRYGKAIELAKAKANSVADQVNQSGKTLKEEFPDSANATGEFTWYSGNTLDFSNPAHVDRPGEDFMTTAFELEPGKAGVALNANRNAAYVVQKIKDDQREESELQDEFFKAIATSQGIPFNVVQRYQANSRRVTEDWLDDVESEMGVKWIAH